jgi:hypothetical protein
MYGYKVVMLYAVIKAYRGGKPLHFFTVPLRDKSPDYLYPQLRRRDLLGLEGFFNYKKDRYIDKVNNIQYSHDTLCDSLDPLQPMYYRMQPVSPLIWDVINHMRYIPVMHLTNVTELFSIIGYDRKKKRFTSEPKYDTNIIEPKFVFNHYVKPIGVPE